MPKYIIERKLPAPLGVAELRAALDAMPAELRQEIAGARNDSVAHAVVERCPGVEPGLVDDEPAAAGGG